MRSWKVSGKYAVLGDGTNITHTEITLSSTSGQYATFTERVLGDHRNKTEQELVELARDAYFKSEYADRAMAEAVQTVDELQQKSKVFDKKILELDTFKAAAEKAEEERAKEFEEIRAAAKANSEAVVAALASIKILTQNAGLKEDVKAEMIAKYPEFKPLEEYANGAMIRHQGNLYEVIEKHKSNEKATPDKDAKRYRLVKL